MKMFKRLAAVLLAGAMVLGMLTACGSGKSNEQKAEDAYLKIFSTLFSTDFQNDSELQSSAKAYLDEVLNDDGTPKEEGKVLVESPSEEEMKNGGKFTVMVVMSKDKDYKVPMAMTSDDLSKFDNEENINAALAAMKSTMNEQDLQTMAQMKDYIKAIGVGCVKKGDNYYVAVAATVEIPQSGNTSGTTTEG